MEDDILFPGPEENQFPPETFLDDEFINAFGEGEEFQRAFGEEPPPKPESPKPEPPKPEPQQKKESPVKKGRPKKKGKYGLLGIPHIVATAIWICLILTIGITAGRMLWLCATDVLAFGREPITATITVAEDDSLDTIAFKLQDAGLIRYTELFKFYVDLSKAEDDIRPGTYKFNDPEKDDETVIYDYMALVSVLTPSSKYTVVEDLRIPEGYTCAQIFKLLEENKICKVEELEEAAMHGDLGEYWFLEGVARDDRYCLEGYLFPDTYDFYEYDDPVRVLKKMLNTFDIRFTDSMRQDLVTLNNLIEDKMRENGHKQAYIEAHKFTIREAVIVASMIEKETANNAESFTVSSVIYNRLTNPGEFPYLNIDATMVYALGGKTDITGQDMQIDHPYNTYKNKGLPPGPIGSPSQNSLAAALQPEDTKYYFYALNPETGVHKFSKTLKEHEDFLKSLGD